MPFTEAELTKLAADLKLILAPELTSIVEIDGEPAAFSVAVPNVNELIADLHGKLWPFGAAKLLYRLKVEGARTARLILLGVRKKFRQQKKYGGLFAYLCGQMNLGGQKLGIRSSELSWTLEDNGPVNAGIRLIGGRVYKRYRVYERALG